VGLLVNKGFASRILTAMDPTDGLSGPYLNAALLCDEVLEEKSGRLSLIRLITEVTVNLAADDPPTEMPAIDIPLTGLLAFNAGEQPGTYAVALVMQDPDGGKRRGPDLALELKHDHHTMNLIVKATLGANVPGVYWVLVLLNEREVTRLPLLVRYAPKTTEKKTPSSPSAGPTARRGNH
jgi:hypothetical protein